MLKNSQILQHHRLYAQVNERYTQVDLGEHKFTFYTLSQIRASVRLCLWGIGMDVLVVRVPQQRCLWHTIVAAGSVNAHAILDIGNCIIHVLFRQFPIFGSGRASPRQKTYCCHFPIWKANNISCYFSTWKLQPLFFTSMSCCILVTKCSTDHNYFICQRDEC